VERLWELWAIALFAGLAQNQGMDMPTIDLKVYWKLIDGKLTPVIACKATREGTSPEM
jgi:hypothetical protein